MTENTTDSADQTMEPPEKLEADDRFTNEGYDVDYTRSGQDLEPDYEAEETPDLEVKVLPIPDDELPDAATDEDEISPSPPVSAPSTAPPSNS